MNPFAPLYKACNTPKTALPDFPRLIDIEITNSCNFRCIFCPTGNRSMKRPTGFMDFGTFVRIIEQCQDRCHGVRFIGWGEPLLHPDISKYVDYATQSDILTHINTNASKLTMILAEELVDAGLSSIKFSFQGIDAESYKKMRKTDFFEGMIKAIERMNTARGHRKFPYIAASTSTTNETKEEIESFKERLEPIVDSLSIGKTIFGFMDLAAARLTPQEREMIEGLIEIEEKTLKHPDPCPEVYDKLTIQWDGTVRVCCNDHSGETNLGNVRTSTLEDIWTHPVLTHYRERLSQKEYSGPLCSTCYQYIEVAQ